VNVRSRGCRCKRRGCTSSGSLDVSYWRKDLFVDVLKGQKTWRCSPGGFDLLFF